MKFLLIVVCFIFFTTSVQAITPVASPSAQFFPMMAMDTMKFSRDRARNPNDELRYAWQVVAKVKEMNATHITIDTPYDEEFRPDLYEWVAQARKHNLKIWYRGNWSGWEGWFDYPKMSDPKEHHVKTRDFILNNPDLFQEGDIFTPAPEPENGIIGDPRNSTDNGKKFNEWLVESYNTCTQAMVEIKKTAACGYFSFNGDVARQSISKETYEKIGGIVVIDHFVKTPEKLSADIRAISKQFGLPVMLGEVGGPIPDIHGEMTEEEQSMYLKRVFEEIVKVQPYLVGVNYWEAFDSSTALFNKEASFSAKLGAQELNTFFNPVIVKGKVIDKANNPVEGAQVEVNRVKKAKTDENGMFQFPVLPGIDRIVVKKDGFKRSVLVVRTENLSARDIHQVTVTLEVKEKPTRNFFDWWWLK